MTATPEHDPSEGPFVPEAHALVPLESVPPRRVGLLKGMLGFWLLPGRLGPYLTCGSFAGALLVSVLSSVVIVAAVGLLIASDAYGDPFYATASMRVSIAALIGRIIKSSGITGFNPLPFAIVVGSPILFTLLGVAYGVFLLPWAQGGGAAKGLSRSIKNGLWCTTVLALSCGAAVYLISQLLATEPRPFSKVSLSAFCAVNLIPLIGTILLARASALGACSISSAAPPRQELMPCCEGCGYNLVGLSVHSACPECGKLVSESFAGGPRDQTRDRFRSALSQRWLTTLRLLKELAFRRATYETLPVYESKMARRVWWLSFAVCAAIVQAAVLFTWWLDSYDEENTIGITLGFQVILPLVFLMHTGSLFNLVWIGRGKHDIRHPCVSVAVGNFAAPMLILPTVIAVVGIGSPTWLGQLIAGTQLRLTLHRWMDFWPIWAIIVLCLLVISIGRWLSCTRYGLRHSRFANY